MVIYNYPDMRYFILRRLLGPIKKRKSNGFPSKLKKEEKEEEDHEDDYDDDASVSSMGTTTTMNDSLGGKEFPGWKPKYSFPIGNVTVEQQKEESVFVSVGLGNGAYQQDRELIFDSNRDATQFCERLKLEQEQEAQRKQDKIEAAFGSMRLPPPEDLSSTTVDLLIDIVACWDIRAADISGTSDPFVVCMMGNSQIHKTDIIYRT